MRFVGIDLAWSEGRPSAVVVLDERGRPEAAAYRTELEELAAFCLARKGMGPVVVGVDAPLRVPNETGQRAAERELLRAFAPFRLGAHAANRRRLEQVHGVVRGEQLASLLARALGAGPGEAMRAADGSAVLEVYPHAALIAWFGLPSPLPYKRGDLATRRRALARLVELLASRRHADPPLQLDGVPWLPSSQEAWESLTAPQLRHLEGLLDAVICAHMAHYFQRWGKERCLVFGSPEEGQIVTPQLPGGSAPADAAQRQAAPQALRATAPRSRAG